MCAQANNLVRSYVSSHGSTTAAEPGEDGDLSFTGKLGYSSFVGDASFKDSRALTTTADGGDTIRAARLLLLGVIPDDSPYYAPEIPPIVPDDSAEVVVQEEQVNVSSMMFEYLVF